MKFINAIVILSAVFLANYDNSVQEAAGPQKPAQKVSQEAQAARKSTDHSWIITERQRSKDGEFNGLYFELPVQQQDIDAGYVRFFLARKELKAAWEGK